MPDDLIGTWRPIEYSVSSRARNGRQLPFGASLRGYLAYDAGGHVIFGVMPIDSATVAAGAQAVRSDARLSGVVGQPAAAFFGTYTVDRSIQSITHRLEGEFPRRSGTAEVATPYRLHGDTLVIGRDSIGARWVFLRTRPK